MFAGKLTRADFDLPLLDVAVTRTVAPCARFSLSDDMIIERGTKADWDLLHDLHYKAENLALGPRFWRLALHGETIGVLVTANPKGLLKERHLAFPNLKPGKGETKITNTQRYNFVNQNFRVISRFVVDTMYRGIGAGYRMMNLVSRLEGARFMEIQSSMSKFNTFGQKAGFSFVRPMNANKYEAGLKFFRRNFEASPQDFEAIVAEVEAQPERIREQTRLRLAEFYYSHSANEKTGANREGGHERVLAMKLHDLVKQAQQITLASPMYGVFKNPDFGRSLPERLPLNAFNWQKPHEPLNLGRYDA